MRRHSAMTSSDDAEDSLSRRLSAFIDADLPLSGCSALEGKHLNSYNIIAGGNPCPALEHVTSRVCLFIDCLLFIILCLLCNCSVHYRYACESSNNVEVV